MKTRQFFAITALLMLIAFAGNAQIKVGAGLSYATDINSAGISINGQYDINEDWAATGGFTYFLEKDYVKWSALDFNANYNITEVGDKSKLYGIGGLNVTFAKLDIPGLSDFMGDVSTSESNVGLNLGAGMNFGLSDKLTLAPEMTYTISSGSYLRIGARIMFSL